MRVLLVEDDLRLARRLKAGLEEEGMAVDALHRGDEVIAAVSTSRYDVLVLDVMLPGISGIEVSRRLRSSRQAVPILMLTGRDAVSDRVTGLESGADDYLIKPFELRELLARVRALSRRHLPDRGSVLTGGRIRLDTGARTCHVGERVVSLTAKEMAILEFFMRHPGQTLSRDQVLSNVWDMDFEGGHNLVEVYIARLRRKLAAVGMPDPFATLRGLGYRFEPAPG